MTDPLLMITLPLLGAFLLPVIERASSPLARWSGPVIVAAGALIGIGAWAGMEGPLVIQLGGFPAPLGITFQADRFSLLFAISINLGTLLLWPVEVGDEPRRAVLALLLAAAGGGLALSGDLFNIFVFYELLSVVSYGLLASQPGTDGGGAVFAATLRYLIVSAVGAVLVLMGIALVYQATGTLNLAQLAELAPTRLNGGQGLSAFVLMLIGFGVKAELFPVNAWVPEVYATASTRVSALLAGVVSKLALLVIVKLLLLVFPLPEAHRLLLLLGMLGMLSGELAAWRARDYKRLLAFSSIGQLGVILIAFSIPGEVGVFAGLAVALHHLLLKPAMFLLARRWGGSLDSLVGAGRRSPWAAGLFILLALSMIGVPPLPGFWAKLVVLVALMAREQPLYNLAGAAILFGAVLEAGYLFRIVNRFYDGEGVASAAQRPTELWRAGLLTGLLLLTLFFIGPLTGRLRAIAREAADVSAYIERINPLPLSPIVAKPSAVSRETSRRVRSWLARGGIAQ